MPSNQVLNQIWHLLLVVPLTNRRLKWTCEAKQMRRGGAGPCGCCGRQSQCRMQHVALGRCRGSEHAAVGLVRYCSLSPADLKRIRRRVCLVMETAPSAMWSLYGFSFSWLLTRKQTTASGAEKRLSSTARMPPTSMVSMLPPNLFSKCFWNFN